MIKKYSFELIREDILSYYNILSNEHSPTKGTFLEGNAKKFILENPNAFLFALIAEQSVKTEVAWSLPYNLKERLGHFDIYKIANYSEEEFEVFLRQNLHYTDIQVEYRNIFYRHVKSLSKSIVVMQIIFGNIPLLPMK